MSNILKPSRIGALLQRAAGRFRRDDRGVAFVEFAFIAPIMVLLFFGTLELSQGITADRRVTKAASSVADLIARVKSTTCDGIQTNFNIAEVLMDPYETTSMSVTVYNIKADANNATVQSVKWSAWNNKGNKAPSPVPLPAGIIEKGGEVIVVTVELDYDSPITKVIMKDTIKLNETFYLKPRLGYVKLTNSGGTAELTTC